MSLNRAFVIQHPARPVAIDAGVLRNPNDAAVGAVHLRLERRYHFVFVEAADEFFAARGSTYNCRSMSRRLAVRTSTDG